MPSQEREKTPRPLDPAPRYASRSTLRSFLSPTRPSLPISHSDPALLTDAMADDPLSPLRPTYAPSTPSPSRTNTSSTTGAQSRRATVSPQRERSMPSWDPPPLFQAYPQSILVANLELPCLPVSLILRMKDGKERSTREEDAAGVADDALPAPAGSKKKEGKARRHHRNLSASISARPWAKKIFMLVTSGYLLQYSDGNQTSDHMHERLPEKVLQLAPHSVAFACDAIPGKPWVLQVSHDANWQARSRAPTSKVMWSRLGFRSAEEKRQATDFLLVLDSAEDLKSWLTAVRKEIEAVGGSQYRPGTADPKLEHKLSQRFQVRRDPNQFAHASSGPPSPFEPTKPFREYEIPEVNISDSVSWLEHSFGRQSLTGSSTLTTTDLDKLRDSSWEATSAKDGQTSLGESNSPVSPTQEQFAATSISASMLPSPDIVQRQASQEKPSTSLSSPDRRLTLEAGSKIRSPPAKLYLDLTQDDDPPVSSTPNFSLRSLHKRPSDGALRSPVRAAKEGSWAVPRSPAPREDPQHFVHTRPVSTIAPLLDRDALAQLDASRGSGGKQVIAAAAAASTAQPGSPPLRHPDHPPTSTFGHSRENSATKLAYTLFPKRFSSLEYSPHRLSLTPSTPSPTETAGTPPATSNARAESNSTASGSSPTALRPPSPRLRRPASLQIRKPYLVDPAERSPAVTDAHFATNFGTAPVAKHVRILGDEEVDALAPKPHAKPRKRDSRVAEKKASAVTQSSSVRKAPALAIAQPGPPPTCPLPEVPSLIRYHNKSDRANAVSEKWLRRNYVDA